MEEGRDRQVNVRSAIHAVLEEHKRQKMYRREDPEKLRMVALNHTSWARDLALAAGASDADAVVTSFAEDRKSREFYLLKMSRSQSTQSGPMPKFMMPHTHGIVTPSPRLVQQKRLDANTAAQLCFRRKMSSGGGSAKTMTSPSTPRESETTETSEPIHDPDPDGDRLAQRAAGFMVEGERRVDMAAVLSGMGAVPQESVAT